MPHQLHAPSKYGRADYRRIKDLSIDENIDDFVHMLLCKCAKIISRFRAQLHPDAILVGPRVGYGQLKRIVSATEIKVRRLLI